MSNLPVTYHVPLPPELVLALEAFAREQRKHPETIIAEALRHYLGIDA